MNFQTENNNSDTFKSEQETDIFKKLRSFDHYSDQETRQMRNELILAFGLENWIEKIIPAAQDTKVAYSIYRIIIEKITPLNSLQVSELLSKDSVSGHGDRSVRDDLIIKLIKFSDRAPEADKKKILENLQISQGLLLKLIGDITDSVFDGDYKWSCELAREDLYNVVKAQILYGDEDVVDKIKQVNHIALSPHLLGQIEALKQKTKSELKKAYYLTQPGVKHKDYFSISEATQEDDIQEVDYMDFENFNQGYDNPYLYKQVAAESSEKIAIKEEINIRNLHSWEQLLLITRKVYSGDSTYLLENIDSFDKVSKTDIIDTLVQHGHSQVVIDNINLFTETDMFSLAKIFIKHGESESVLSEDLFKNIKKDDLILSLIDFDQVQSIFSHIDQFPKINIVDLSRDIIKKGKTGHLVLCFDKIPKEYHSEIINLMVDSGYSTVFRTIVENCTDIDQSIAHKFILHGRGSLVLTHQDHFLITDPTSLINTVIEKSPIEFFHGWEEFLKKYSLEMDFFMEKLISSGSCSMIIQYKSFFKDIDYPRVADILFKNKDFGRILTEWDTFKNHIASKDIVFSMLSSGEYQHLFGVLEIGTLGITDTKFIFDELVNTGKDGVVLRYIQHFPDLDVNNFLLEMIRKGQVGEVLENLRKLPISLHHELVNKIFSENKTEELRQYLDIISGLSIEAILSIDGLSSGGYISIFERIREHSLSIEDTKTLFCKHSETFGQEEQDRIIKRLYSQHYYQELEILLLTDPEGVGLRIKNLVDISNISESARKMISIGNFQSGKSLANIAMHLGIDITDLESNIDFSQIESSQNFFNRERESYRKTNINQEIAKFYLDEYIRFELFGLKTALRLGIFPEGDRLGRHKLEGINRQQDLELSRVQDKIVCSKLEKEGVKHIDFMVDLFREYLIFACTSEMRHQDQVGDYGNDVTINGIFRYKNNSSEEIRLYFNRCRDRFNTEGWLSSYGGKAWANIAQCGMDIWNDNLDEAKKIFLIDRIIDIQHNSGRIFDKDFNRMVFAEGSLAYFLDYRKNASNIDDLLKFCLKEDLITQQEAAEYIRKRDTLHKLKDFSITPVKREFSD